MPLKEIGILKETASKKAEEHLETVFKVPVWLEAMDDEIVWESIMLRTVYRQNYTVWIDTGQFEVETDAAGRIVRFVDHARMERAGAVASGETELNPAFLKEIAMTTGLVSPHGRVVGVAPSQEGPVSVDINQYVPGFPVRANFKIDPGREVVVALNVMQWEES
jgi:hypothetical protein